MMTSPVGLRRVDITMLYSQDGCTTRCLVSRKKPCHPRDSSAESGMTRSVCQPSGPLKALLLISDTHLSACRDTQKYEVNHTHCMF